MKTRYAVMWSEGYGPSYAGSLALDDGGLVLDGVAHRGTRTLRRVLYGDISSVHVGRAPRERLARRPALIVAAGPRPELRLVSLEGPGVTGELEDRIAAVRRGA